MNTKIAAVEDAIRVKEINSIDLISVIFAIFSPRSIQFIIIIVVLFNIFSYFKPLNRFKSKNKHLKLFKVSKII
jgi:hypothetical protein